MLKFPWVSEVIHLGQHLNEDIYKFSANKCVEDFNRQCNMYFANFKYANSYVRNVLFHKYCTAFYGSQILHFLINCMDDVYISWRIAMHKVQMVSSTTHCNLLPHLDAVMDPVLWFSKRCIKFIKMALNSDNIIVRTITNVGVNSFHSIMGGNWRHLRSKYGMEECNVIKRWDEKCKNE